MGIDVLAATLGAVMSLLAGALASSKSFRNWFVACWDYAKHRRSPTVSVLRSSPLASREHPAMWTQYWPSLLKLPETEKKLSGNLKPT